MNVNSPKFEQSWNEVSRALLRLVQVAFGDDDSAAHNIVDFVISAATNVQPGVVRPTESAVQPAVRRTKVSELYTNSPVSIGDGVFIFKRLHDDPEGRFYKVITYDDDSCEFELLTSIDGEYLQDLVANQTTLLAPAVACVTGSITENAKINVTKPGKAVADGRIVRITEPMEVNFI